MTKLYEELKELAKKAKSGDITDRLMANSVLRDKLQDNLPAILSALKPRWIPVSERLPEIGQRVLCRGKGPDVIPHAYYDAWLQPDQGGTPVNWMMFGRIRLNDDAVTDWMPLPDAAQSQEDRHG